MSATKRESGAEMYERLHKTPVRGTLSEARAEALAALKARRAKAAQAEAAGSDEGEDQ